MTVGHRNTFQKFVPYETGTILYKKTRTHSGAGIILNINHQDKYMLIIDFGDSVGNKTSGPYDSMKDVELALSNAWKIIWSEPEDGRIRHK